MSNVTADTASGCGSGRSSRSGPAAVPEVIIVDWGTTSFRAWLVQRDTGAVIEEISNGVGMRDLPPRPFADYCAERLGPWLDRFPRPPVYLAGMVGAPTGWTTAPQLAVPQDAASLGQAVVPAPGLPRAWILPGVKVDTEGSDRVDVMRGEEVQILGALALTGRRDAILCLPGTHSKWVRVESGRIVDFTTFMTGEFHGVLMAHSLLGQGCPEMQGGRGIKASFHDGLHDVDRHGGGLLSHAFAARTRRLLRDLAVEDVSDFLSGVLIGEEIRGALAMGYLPCPDVVLVGASHLAQRYQAALSEHGWGTEVVLARDASLSGVRAVVDAMPA